MSGSDNFPGAGEFFPSDRPRGGTPETAELSGGARVRTVTLPLDTAMDNFELIVKGNQLWAVDASDLDVAINVKYNEQSGQGIPIAKGFALKGVPFNKIYITSAAQAGKTITLLTTFISGAPVEFVNPTNSANEVKLLKGSTFRNSFPSQSAANVSTIAADNDRIGLMLTSWPGNDQEIYVGATNNATTLLNEGLEVSPGDSLVFTEAAAGELYWRVAAGTQFFSIFEELR